MVEVGETKLELIEPVGPAGTIAKFIESRGEGIHHICVEVDDIVQAMKDLSDKGLPADRQGTPPGDRRQGRLHSSEVDERGARGIGRTTEELILQRSGLDNKAAGCQQPAAYVRYRSSNCAHFLALPEAHAPAPARSV